MRPKGQNLRPKAKSGKGAVGRGSESSHHQLRGWGVLLAPSVGCRCILDALRSHKMHLVAAKCLLVPVS